jgi:hypothetical protein
MDFDPIKEGAVAVFDPIQEGGVAVDSNDYNPIESEKRAEDIFDASQEYKVPLWQVHKTFGEKVKDWGKEFANDSVGIGYKLAETWQRGFGDIAISADKVLNYIEENSPGGHLDDYGWFEKVGKSFNDSADYWAEKANKQGVSAVGEFLGEMGGVPSGIAKFIAFKPLVAGIEGAAEAKENEQNEVLGFFLGAMQRKAIGKLFEAIAPYKASIKLPTMAALGAGQVTTEGGSPKEIAKGAATMALLSMSPDGQIGIRDLRSPQSKIAVEKRVTEQPVKVGEKPPTKPVKATKQVGGMVVPKLQEVATNKTPVDVELEPSRLAQRTEELAIEKKLTENLGDLAGYEKTPEFMKRQAELVKSEMDRDYEFSKKIALGKEKPLNQEIRPASMYEGVKFRATMEGDIETLRNLALPSETSVPTRLSQLGQEIKAADVRNPEDPVAAMTDVIKTAEKSFEKKTGKKVKAAKREGVKELKEFIAKESKTRTIRDWESFVDSIRC